MLVNSSEDIQPSSSKVSANEEFTVFNYPSRKWFSYDWAEIWEHRELFYFLALRDIKIKYKQTLLGIIWVLLQPTIGTIVFSILFSHIGQNVTLEVPYAPFAFSGFTIWVFLASAISSSSVSMISNSNLVTKVYFPRLVLPLAAIAANLLDLVFGLLSLGVVMVLYSVPLGWTSIFALLFLMLCFALVTSLGVILSAINVRYRDVKYILPVALQLWLFVTPVFYSLEMLPEESRWIWKLNPITGIVNGFRASLFGTNFDYYEIGFSVVLTIILIFLALHVFYRMEESFADLM